MSGLLIRELELRGLAERISDRLPGQPRLSVAARAEREVRRQVPRHQGPGYPRPVRREPVAGAQPRYHLARPRQAPGDPAGTAAGPLGPRHRRRGAPHVGGGRVAQEPRYRLGELLRDISDHMLLLTATPHKGDPQNFSLFLQLLDADAYADVRSIREAIAEKGARDLYSLSEAVSPARAQTARRSGLATRGRVRLDAIHRRPGRHCGEFRRERSARQCVVRWRRSHSW